jgi:hypothetical protein
MVASALSPAPVSAITVPIPKVWWRTRSPISKFKLAFWELDVTRFPVGATVGFGFDLNRISGAFHSIISSGISLKNLDGEL